MGRLAGSKNKTRDADDVPPDDDSPGPGHNESGPTDALLLKYKREIITLDEKIEEITDERKSKVAEVRGKYKAAKKAGIHIEALRRAIADSKRAPDEVKVETQEWLRMTNLFRMPTTQEDLFPEGASYSLDPNSPEGRQQAKFDAGIQGLRAGKSGFLISDNPYHQTEDSEEYTAWVKQWHAGQAHLAKGLTPKRTKGLQPNGPTEDDRTQLQQDEEAYRAKGVSTLVGDMPADPVLN